MVSNTYLVFLTGAVDALFDPGKPTKVSNFLFGKGYIICIILIPCLESYKFAYSGF